MFEKDRWQEIFSAIKQNKIRSALTAFGVFWAIFMLVVMVGSGNGLKNGVTDGFKDFAQNSGFMWSNPTTKAFGGFQRGRRWFPNNLDAEQFRDNVKGLDIISPRLSGWGFNNGENVVRGLRSGSYSITGDYPQFQLVDPSTFILGRNINEEDIRLKRKVCVIGEMVYDVMFDKNEDPIGKSIRVNGVYFTVIGVSKPKGFDHGNRKVQTIYLPFSSMQQAYNFGDQIDYFAFTAKEGYQVQEVMDELIAILQKNHSIAPDDFEAIGKVNIEEKLKQMNFMFLGINILIWVVGIGTLIAGAVGISNIMLIVVKERTKEIGIQRAIGAPPRIIVSQILTESVFLTLSAGFLGLAFGTIVLQMVDTIVDASRAMAKPDQMTFFLNPQVGLSLALSALGMLIFAGFIAGLIPALKAVRIKPIDALRHE